MSHIGTRIVADRLANPTLGIAALVTLLVDVLDVGDALPAGTVSVIDDTRGSVFAALPDDATSYPLVRVVTQDVNYGVIQPSAVGPWTRPGALTLGVQLLLRETTREQSAEDGMYLLRAIRDALSLFSAAPSSERERCGVQLQPHSSMRQGAVDAPLGDLLESPGSYLVTYPFVESIPFTGVP